MLGARGMVVHDLAACWNVCTWAGGGWHVFDMSGTCIRHLLDAPLESWKPRAGKAAQVLSTNLAASKKDVHCNQTRVVLSGDPWSW